MTMSMPARSFAGADAAPLPGARRGPVLTSLRGAKDLPRWFGAVFDTVSGLRRGRVRFTLPDGRVFAAEGREAGPDAEVLVRDARLFARMIRDGEMGFAEGYLDGWWDTPDLQAVLDLALLNNESVSRRFGGAALVRAALRLRHWMNRNTKAQARRNIAAHYDLGNDFYALWLDRSMTYSSALFRDGGAGAGETMEEGQASKYAALLDAMNPPAGGHVLEIGCGWGGFAEYAAKARGLKVTALTISKEQHDFAAARMQREGLSEQVEIVMRDYRDETGSYDGIGSIEMFEAVGERYWPAYFSAVHDRLRPGARATIQSITIADPLFDGYRKGVDFVQKYIFPGGMLPSPTRFREQAGAAGLLLDGSVEFGASYAETLRRWRATFNARWDEIEPMGFDDRFRRMWDFYLASCAACFMAGTTDVSQFTLSRPG
ncbi:class I SAM-dependent methyltransferase [Rhodovulum sp. DZ06]|uniref:class I SAM-dependent methyltransferase n=1 Tax=Rhodovulum sp. DZ06 TaxID=3425126 RepID=UPI003D34CC6C